MPIYFGYPTENKYNIIMEVPEGYAVESIPKPIKIATVKMQVCLYLMF
jgi:hypothetical protein